MKDIVLLIAMNKAYNRSPAVQLKSHLASRLHQWKKVSRFPANAATLFTNLVPLPPGVGTAIETVVGELTDKVQERLRKRRLEQARSDYQTIKFTIKTMKFTHMDESRRKLQKCIQGYNEAEQEVLARGAPCRRAYKLAYRYYRLENRLSKLSVEAAALIELGEQILGWTSAVKQCLDESKMKSTVDAVLQQDHRSCGKACFMGRSTERVPLVGPAQRIPGPLADASELENVAENVHRVIELEHD